MAASTEPRSGLFYGWALGENNWKEGMDANLLHIGRFGFHLSVKDRDLTTPPSSQRLVTPTFQQRRAQAPGQVRTARSQCGQVARGSSACPVLAGSRM